MKEDPAESAAPARHGKYLTAPVPTDRMPPGIPYIVGNEAAERFSFYGMRAVLMTFMTDHLLNAAGQRDVMSEPQAQTAFHVFIWAVYFFPLFGGLISDVFLGKYRTIIILSIVYCFGHLALAIDHTRLGLLVGLSLIAIGSGGIKPCVSANVGDQFGPKNQYLLERVFTWFYFSINLGAAASNALTPELLKIESFGPHLAFGVPGVLMVLATVVFWIGRKKFVHVPPGGRQVLRQLMDRENLRPLLRLLPLYLFVSVFWCLSDQTGSEWVNQAKHMNREVFGFTVAPGQVQTINPILIMIFIPLFSYVVYPAIGRIFKLTALRKIGLGLFLASLSFLVPAFIETRIEAGMHPHVVWQWLAFFVITAAEMMVSITCLEFSYTQAPTRMKSLIMSAYLLSIAAGNAYAAAFNYFVQENESLKLSGTHYYSFFAGVMGVVAVLFVFYARGYREHVYLQEESPAAG